MCSMCGAAEGTVFHFVTECSVMAQNEYKGRHDKVAKILHIFLCVMYFPEKDVETADVKIL